MPASEDEMRHADMTARSRGASSACIVTINGGSSTIKFAAFDAAEPSSQLWSGMVDRIGRPDARLRATGPGDAVLVDRAITAANHQEAADRLIDWLVQHLSGGAIRGIGHRVVHGGMHRVNHQRITRDLVDELRRTQPLDLAHLPREIALIESFGRRFPGVPQIACFDTAFHRNLPEIAQRLPIPRRYHDAGVRRLGFHGLSYAYLMRELQRQAGPAAAAGRVILAHLGSGASMAAVRNGRPVDTTMGFTPTGGLVMATRPGDLDPGLLVYMMRAQKLTAEQMDEFISHRCGLLGVSETSADMRELLARRDADPRALQAVELFCYQARKWIGSYAAVLGGLDTLVFAGGIGQHSPQVRAQICADLQFLGIILDANRNAAGAAIISGDRAAVTVRVMHTDEEVMIAQFVNEVLQQSGATA